MNFNSGGNWIGSFWAGSDSGMFLDAGGGAVQGFTPYYKQNDAQITAGSAVYLCFPN
jgi:hypothetical protein